MLGKLVFLAVIGVFLVDATCDTTKFVACQDKFADKLGIDRVYNWLNPLGLTLQIQDIYINGGVAAERGLNVVCNAYNSMVQCLSDASTTTFECFDIGYLLTHSSAPNQAYSYGFLMSMLQYQCGAGFYLASDNWQCMQRIYNGKNATMYGCITDFVLNAQEDPKRGCNYVQTGMDCFSKASILQGCPDELKYYGCESFRQYSLPQFARCDKQCSIDTQYRGI
ncbi:hypothetical protein GCK72_013403 [Caenorhabditis remanei]|uniref:DUF19 domain-containing protein n=1 Tax=Caenorhabditis remanei TaxID=31234 RepID=A0A6A5GNH1_CAERE|nr:hypothetical protein GCK72_013403 [Caenorhabditis remanei]KAF1756948.1 hypothetical protein GCK72_013403 [Caenorhabditis remanei]